MLSKIMAAIDQVINDGVDVLSFSIATTGPYPLSIYNAMPWVLTVASGTNDRQLTSVVTLGNGLSIPGTSLYHGSFSFSQIPMFFMDECNNIFDGAHNKISDCFNENETLDSQLLMIQNSKALASVFITDKDYMLDYIEYDFPIVNLILEDGRIVRDYIKEEALRPNLVRQDGSLGEFNVDSGTSMACPYAMGLAKILKVVSPAAIRSAMMTTSFITCQDFILI
ncbi:subtilisin-like protease SBT1.9 [Tanacetum coccineum]